MYAAFVQQNHGYTNNRTGSPRPASKQRRRNDVKINSSASSSPNRDRAPSRDQSPLVKGAKGMKPSASSQALSASSSSPCHVCHDNQSSLVNSVARIEICDKLGNAAPSSASAEQSPKSAATTTTKTGNGNSPVKSSSSAVGMGAPEFALALESVLPPLVLDCRSFISYNLCHVRGAINVGCADRVTKRRLQSGKICVADLIKCQTIRERFLANVNSAFVVYDDDTSDITAEGGNNSCGGSSLQLILKSLQSRDIKAHYLKGGLAEFHARYEQLCNKPKPTGATPLYSPTTPIVSNEIDTAVASKVLPFLFVGNERDASNRERLRELGITHVLNVTSHIPCHFESDAICYKRIKASDSGCQNLKQYFTEASSFIDEVQSAGGKVLVHCQAGVSRSVTITVAYIMLHSRMSMMDAFKYVKSCRSIVAPNFNFMGQLMEFEKCLESGNIVRNLGVDLGIPSRV